MDTADFGRNAVTLMTLHAAKGLEFPVVFVTGLEEGLFPLAQALDDRGELEEERRLMYVGITRAKQKLYLSYARSATGSVRTTYSMKSRFLDEMDEGLVCISKERAGQPRAYRAPDSPLHSSSRTSAAAPARQEARPDIRGACFRSACPITRTNPRSRFRRGWARA